MNVHVFMFILIHFDSKMIEFDAISEYLNGCSGAKHINESKNAYI